MLTRQTLPGLSHLPSPPVFALCPGQSKPKEESVLVSSSSCTRGLLFRHPQRGFLRGNGPSIHITPRHQLYLTSAIGSPIGSSATGRGVLSYITLKGAPQPPRTTVSTFHLRIPQVSNNPMGGSLICSLFCFCFETECKYVVLAGLELTMQSKLALNSEVHLLGLKVCTTTHQQMGL